MRKKVFQFLVFISIYSFFGSLMYGQNADKKISFGIESEMMCFINKGYHGSFWVGYNGFRSRFVAARATYPSSLSPKGFKDLTSQFYELEVDTYIGKKRKEYRGFWFGTGLGLTKQSMVSEETNLKGKINLFDLHGGIGYTIGIYKGLYVNPWIGLDLHTNTKTVVIGNQTWKPHFIDPVGGAKIGYSF